MASEKKSLDGLKIDREQGETAGRRTWVLLAATLVLLVAGGVGAWLARSRPLTVRTAAARELETGGARTLLNGSGYLVARREATVSSKVTGKVVEVTLEEGMKVEAGAVLARLDDTNVRASLNLAKAQLDSAQSARLESRVRAVDTEKEWKRLQRLAEDHIASQADLDHAEAEARSWTARLEKQAADVAVAEREVAVWQQQLEDTVIRAPFSGMITAKNAQPGEMISPMSAGGGFTRTGICTLVDMGSLEIEVDVNESYINRVVTSMPVEATLDAYPDWKIPAHVIAIIPTADRQKATVKVRVGFDKLDARMLPQMGVKVAFREAGEKPAASRSVAVPKTAVRKLAAKDVVWVVRDGRTERRAVSVRGTRGEDVLLEAGVAAGERVVVETRRELTDQDRVKEAGP